jgi:hypothetical protein
MTPHTAATTGSAAPGPPSWRQRISVSAVFAASLRFVQHDAAWRRSLAAAGGTDDITDEDSARTDAEFRELGLIP